MILGTYTSIKEGENVFKGMISNYIQYLTPINVLKFAATNGIELTQDEAIQTTTFIKENYQLVLAKYNEDYVIQLIKENFKEESQEKLIRLVKILKRKYNL